jgi:DNA-binding GntR family transcriptional regulator
VQQAETGTPVADACCKLRFQKLGAAYIEPLSLKSVADLFNVRTVLVELVTGLVNPTLRQTIWKTPLDYQTRDIRRFSADPMASTLKAIRQRRPNAAVKHLGQLLESDRDRALCALSRIRGETFDPTALSRSDEYGGLPVDTARS